MEVAKKSPKTRQTLTLPLPVVEILDRLRGSTSKSRYLQHLLEREVAEEEKRTFYARAAAAYTPVVREETLALNAEFPIHEK